MDARLIILAAAALLLVFTFVYLVSSIVTRRREKRIEHLVGPAMVLGPPAVVASGPLALDGWAPQDEPSGVGAPKAASAPASVAPAPPPPVAPAPVVAAPVPTPEPPPAEVSAPIPVAVAVESDDLLAFLPGAPQPPVRLSVEDALSELESAIAKVGPIESAPIEAAVYVPLAAIAPGAQPEPVPEQFAAAESGVLSMPEAVPVAAPTPGITGSHDELAAIAASLEEMMGQAPVAAPVEYAPPVAAPVEYAPPVAAPEPVAPDESTTREPEVEEYRMISPVEVHFGDGPPRVGIRPGTATFLKFQRLAQVLLTDLRRATSDV